MTSRNKHKKISKETDISISEAQELVSTTNTTKKDKMSFDAYFQIILKNGLVFAHHKAPLRNHMTACGLELASVAEFNLALKKY